MIQLVKLKVSNAYLVQGERIVIVDAGSANEETTILQAIDCIGSRADVSLIVLTHGHCDHAGCAAKLRDVLGAPIAAHHADRAMLEAGRNGIVTPTRLSGRIIRPFIDKPFPGVTPDVAVEDGFSLSDYGVAARVLETPGHTAGSISIVFETGSAIIGDLAMGGHLGGAILAGKPRLPYFAEDLAALRESLRRVIETASGTIYCGHGGPLEYDRFRETFDARTD